MTYFGEVKEFFTSNRHKPQFLACFAASIGLFALGTISSWTSPALPSLLADPNISNLTTEEQSWIASLVPLGALISGPIFGASLDYNGRKLTLILQSLLLVVGWILLACSQNITMIYAGRFITGLCAGSLVLAPVVYITDVCESEVRGKLGSVIQAMAYIGIVFSYTLGSFVSWRWLAGTDAAIPLISILLMVFVPESPRYLLENDKVDKAVQSMCWLRGTSDPDDVQTEIETIQLNLVHNTSHSASIKMFLSRKVMKPLLVSVGMMMLTQFVGFNALLYFSVSIFVDAGTGLDAHLSSIIVAIVLVLAVPCASYLIDRSGRRVLLLVSAALIALAHFALGLYFYLKISDESKVVGLGWLPLVSIILFFAAYGIGIGPVPWLVMTEIIPNQVVGTASGICTSVHFISGFIVTKYFKDLEELIGDDWTFWVFALVSVFGFIFVLFSVPETKLRTLEEIQQHADDPPPFPALLRRLSLSRGGSVSLNPNPGYQTFSGSSD